MEKLIIVSYILSGDKMLSRKFLSRDFASFYQSEARSLILHYKASTFLLEWLFYHVTVFLILLLLVLAKEMTWLVPGIA